MKNTRILGLCRWNLSIAERMSCMETHNHLKVQNQLRDLAERQMLLISGILTHLEVHLSRNFSNATRRSSNASEASSTVDEATQSVCNVWYILQVGKQYL